MRGLFVAVCGLDGAGKTTQIRLLHNWYEEMGISCELTKQPTDFYRQDERVRDYLDKGQCSDMSVLALLAAADRRWHLSTIIEPTLAQGKSIISDRYLYSSLAYFKVRGISPDFVKMINGNIRIPDLTIFLDLDASTTLSRVKERDKKLTKYEEREPRMFLEIRDAFKEVLPKDALIIDGTLDREEIHKIIINRVQEKLEDIKRGEIYEIK